MYKMGLGLITPASIISELVLSFVSFILKPKVNIISLKVYIKQTYIFQGRDKLCVSVGEPVRIVLESDGTQVEDGEYFQTLPENTIFIVLRPGEAWAPAGEDIVSQGEPQQPSHIKYTILCFSCVNYPENSL